MYALIVCFEGREELFPSESIFTYFYQVLKAPEVIADDQTNYSGNVIRTTRLYSGNLVLDAC